MTSENDLQLRRPEHGDVVDLIIQDHEDFERLLRALRNDSNDRDQLRHQFATLHVAHAEAEEKYVYPRLERRNAVDEEEVEHGEKEHAEGHEALLALLEFDST